MARTTFLPLILMAMVLCKVSPILSSSPELQADHDDHCTVGKDDDSFWQPQSVDGGPTTMDSDLGE